MKIIHKIRTHNLYVKHIIKIQNIYRKRKAYRNVLSIRIDQLLEKRLQSAIELQSMICMYAKRLKYIHFWRTASVSACLVVCPRCSGDDVRANWCV